jgi:hypothetical protein
MRRDIHRVEVEEEDGVTAQTMMELIEAEFQCGGEGGLGCEVHWTTDVSWYSVLGTITYHENSVTRFLQEKNTNCYFSTIQDFLESTY